MFPLKNLHKALWCTLEAIVFSLHLRVSQSIEWSLTQCFSSTLGTLFWNQVTTMSVEVLREGTEAQPCDLTELQRLITGPDQGLQGICRGSRVFPLSSCIAISSSQIFISNTNSDSDSPSNFSVIITLYSISAACVKKYPYIYLLT